jgi:hypothetical protein
MSTFNVLRWAVPDCVKDSCPDGIKVLKFEKRDVVIVWFKTDVLIYDNVKLCELQTGSFGNSIVSLSSFLNQDI